MQRPRPALERMQKEMGFGFPRHLGWTTSQSVAIAVVRAIRRNLPEIIVNTLPLRPVFVLSQLFPRFTSWLVRIACRHHFRRVAFERDNRLRRTQRKKAVPGISRAA